MTTDTGFTDCGCCMTIEHEHAYLRDVMEALRDEIVGRTAAPIALADRFASLLEEVLDHFEFEERGGYFSEAISRAPRLADRADAILREHERLAGDLVELQRYAKLWCDTEDWWEGLSSRYLRFLSRFHAHESREHDLLNEAYNTDIGGGD